MSADTADSATDPTPGDDIREAMAAATTSHEVQLAIDSYEWASPLDVIDTSDPVEWDAPFTTDWWTRTILVEGGRGATYQLVYSSIGDPARAECYRYDAETDQRGDKRGDIESLALVDLDEYVLMRGTASSRGDVYHRPDPENPDEPGCSVTATKGEWYRKDPAVLGEDWSLCSYCDDSESPDDEDDEHAVGDELPSDAADDPASEDDKGPEQRASAEAVLPDDISESDVADAVDEHRTGPRPRAELGDVAETLGLDPNKTRTILVVTNNYRKVREVTSSKGGGR